MPTRSSSSATRRSACLPLATPCTSRGSMMENPTVTRGSSEAKGSWNTNWISRRSACSSAVFSLVMSRPPKWTWPPWLSTSRSSERPVVDLPQPDSPTSDRVSPG
ncbi:Uncharacterised protein [Bordetella pertussis]|nr:Uncharacterised protein [Bordetella pertussis]